MLRPKIVLIFLLFASLIVACREKDNNNTNTDELSKPVNLEIVKLGSSSIKLSWTDNSVNEDGFRIYRNNQLIKETKANAQSYTDTGLEKKQYHYGVSSFKDKKESVRVGVSIDLRQNPNPVGGCKIFPDSNAWNADISELPVHPNSENYLNSIGLNVKLHPDFGTVWNGVPNGIPYNIVDKNTPKYNLIFDYADESDKGPYPIPDSVKIEGGPKSDGDRHILLLDNDGCKLYELYNAWPPNSPQNGYKRNWQAGSGAIFDLNSNKLRPDYWTSADAAGLPIFPGLVRYQEAVEKAEINHALRFTVERTQKAFIHPATHYASDNSDPNLPPMGLRLRLKKDFDISGFSPEVQVILKALKKYGMFVADNGGNMFISGTPDPKWNDEHLAELKQIPASALEAVYTGNIVGQDDAQWLPKAEFTMSTNKTEVFQNVDFDASESYDADGSIQKYEWFFGDGFKASGEKTSHKYQNSGRFMVRLDVTDNDNLVNTKVVPILISNAANTDIEKIEYVLDPSFESKKHNFSSYYDKVDIGFTNRKPITGKSSLKIGFSDWSSAVLAIDYPWQAGPRAKSINLATKLQIDSATANTTIEVCLQTFSLKKDNEIEQESCESVKSSNTGLVELSPSLVLDPNKHLSRIYFWINFSHTGNAEIRIDDTHFILEAIKGSGGNPE